MPHQHAERTRQHLAANIEAVLLRLFYATQLFMPEVRLVVTKIQ